MTLSMSLLIPFLPTAKLEGIEKERVAAYRELWKCLGGILTHNSEGIVTNLTAVQERLQKWYYDDGCGLFIWDQLRSGSTKAAFFTARDLQSSDPYEIWHVFHDLRRGVRADLGVFESDRDEAAAMETVKKKLRKYEN